MTIVAAGLRLFDLFAFHRRSGVEQQNTAARPPNLRSGRLSVVLCFGAIAIGIIALTGYVLGNASIASLGTNGKPVAAVTALALIVLGAGLLALRWPAPAGLLTARRAALAVIVIAAADLLSAAFSRHIEEWKVWAARSGVDVHPYPIAAFLLIASASALVFMTTRRDFAGHVIASTVLLICAVFSFAYFLKVPSFLDPSRLIAPAAGATLGLALISVAEVLARPRGWVIPLLSRTSAGTMSRLLLPAAFIVPFLALALRNLIADVRWFTPEVGLTVIVAVNVFFSAAIVLGAGVLLHKRANAGARLASIVESSDDAIIAASSQGLIESWNGGAERMYGYTAAEAMGRSATMLAPPELRDEVPLLLERVRRGERVDHLETVRVTKDGRAINVWLSVSPILDDQGNLVGASSIAHDITGLKKDEEVIRRMAEQHEVLLATSSDGFWLVDLEGRLLDVNDAYCRMSGYSREELLELRISDIEAIETPVEIASRIRNIVESGVAHFETKHRTKDNRILDIEISVSVWRTADRGLVFSRDITQRKQEQEALRSSEERLQLAQRAAGIGHFSWDIQTNITTRSDEMSVLYGLPPASLGGKHENWTERIFPDDLPAVEAQIQNALISGELSQYFRVVWPDASIHWLLARGKVFFSDDGKPLRMVGVNMDISERKFAEEAMLRSEARYRTLVENLPQKIMLKDRNSVYVSVNEAYARDLGIEPKAVAGKTDHDFFPGDLAGKYRADDARIMEAGVTEDLEEEYLEEGQRRFIHTVKTPVKDAQGNVTHILVIFWDITEKKLAGEQLKKAMADLEGLNRDLKKSEAALKEAQRVAQVGHWEWSTLTGATMWSDEVYRILGIPIGSVPSYELFLGMIDPKDRRRLEEEVARALDSSSDRDVDIDLRIITPAGAALMVSERIFVDRDAGGKVVMLHGTIQDITKRVETEEALRDSEAALTEAQKIANIGSAIVYPETGEIHASDEYFRIFDLEPRPGTPINAFLNRVHEEDRGAVKAALTAAVSSGTFDVEFRIVCGDGGIRFAHGIAGKRVGNSRILGLLGAVQDVTERKRTEDALRQHSEILERSNLELERFNRLVVGRELRMVELKRQVNDLCAQLGQPAPYVLPEERALARETP